MKKQLTLLVCMLLCRMLFSQAVPMALEEWRTTNGTQNFYYKAVTKTDPSGNVIVAGTTLDGATTDILVAKYNAAGNQLWIQQFQGAATGGVDFAAGLFADNNYIYITGGVTNNSVTPETDCVTMKLASSTGSVVWSTSYDGAGNFHDAGRHIVVDGSGNVYVSGGSYNASMNTDFLCLKYNSSGVQQWASTWDYLGFDDAATKGATSGSNLNLTGAVTTATPNVYKVATLSLSQSTGSLLATSVGTAVTTTSVDVVTDFTSDGSGNIIVVGSNNVVGEGNNFYVQKLSNTLVSTWTYTWNGSSSLNDVAKAVELDASGNVYIAGFSTSSTLGRELTLIKLNSSGTFQWAQTSGFGGDDEAADMIIDASSGIYVGGYKTNSTKDYYTAKYNASGTKIWETEMDGNYGLNDYITNITLDSLNNVIITGQTESAPSKFNFTTLKYTQRDIINVTEIGGTVNDKTFLFYNNIGQEMDESLAPVTAKKFVTSTSPKYYFEPNLMSMVFASAASDSNVVDTIHRVDLLFENSNEDAGIYANEPYGINISYILGQLSKPMNAPKGNQRLYVPELYNGIDLQYYSNKDGGLKYYFIVKPGADPRDIIQYFNSTSYTTAINGSNQLVITSSVGKMTLDVPFAYQLTAIGTPTALVGSAAWHTYASHKYDFTLPSYTSSLTLVIMVNQVSPQQPLNAINLNNLKWSTFMGGGEDDQNWDVAIDKFGNQHVAGASNSLNLPVVGTQLINTSSIHTSNRYGVYYKFNALNQKIVCTYFGGDQQTEAINVSTNSQGDAYITGITQAVDIPFMVENGAYNDTVAGNTFGGNDEDGYILKFNAANQYVWGTYFGGTNNDGIFASTIDKNDNLYITGRTSNSSLPLVSYGSAYQHTFNGSRDVFIGKFNTNDSLVWFTYYGGTNQDESYSCKTDTNNNLFITGTTISNDFPHYRASSSYYKDSTLNGTLNDIFILKFNSAGVRQWSTLYGGSGYDYSLSYVAHKGITFDNDQNIYILDNTLSSDLFTKRLNGTCYYDSTYGGNTDGFLLKLSSGLVLQYATYIGETDYDFAHAVSFDSNNNLYLSYCTASGGTSTAPFGGYYYQNTMIGTALATFGVDNFLLSLNSNMNTRWASFLGGTSHNAIGDGGTSIAIKGTDMYLTGFCNSYYVNSSDIRFPISYDGIAYIDSTYNDNAQANTCDGFIGKFDLAALVGIEELFKENTTGLTLFPNPANNSLNIKFVADKQEKVKLSIFTIDGKLVFESSYPVVEGINLIKMNIHSLSTGMYIVKMQNDRHSVTEKFIKYE